MPPPRAEAPGVGEGVNKEEALEIEAIAEA
jgi:hypothetical protein